MSFFRFLFFFFLSFFSPLLVCFSVYDGKSIETRNGWQWQAWYTVLFFCFFFFSCFCVFAMDLATDEVGFQIHKRLCCSFTPIALDTTCSIVLRICPVACLRRPPYLPNPKTEASQLLQSGRHGPPCIQILEHVFPPILSTTTPGSEEKAPSRRF